MMQTLPPRHVTRGFSLVEVTLALGIAGFCLISLFGLLPIGVNSNQNSVEQTAAASAAASVISDLRSVNSGASGVAVRSPLFGVPLPLQVAGDTSKKQFSLFLREDGTQAVPTGTSLTSIDEPGKNAVISENPRYRVTLNFVVPPSKVRTATAVRVLVTWPATADPKVDNLPTRASGSFETTTALDRN